MHFAVRVCPRLCEVADEGFILLSRDYRLYQHRLLGSEEGPASGSLLCDLFEPDVTALGFLDFYLAEPLHPQILSIREWLAHHAPALG